MKGKKIIITILLGVIITGLIGQLGNNKNIEIGDKVNLEIDENIQQIPETSDLDIPGIEVNFDFSKGYLINNYIQIIKNNGNISLYNDEGNNFNIKARLELLREKIVVGVVEVGEVRPGYVIGDVKIKGLRKGLYPTKVEIIKILDTGEEETLDRLGVMIEIR